MDNATRVPKDAPKWTRPRNARSLKAEDDFRARLEELGAVLLETAWLGSKVTHRAICAAGHACTPTPHYVQHGDGICKTCAGTDPAAAEAAFRRRLIELGAELLEPYQNAQAKHKIRCANNHICYQKPMRLQQGVGVCWECSGLRFGAGEEAFRRRVAELGGTPLYETWTGSDRPHKALCVNSHTCYPIPANVGQGQGICRTCAGRDPAAAEANFRARIGELGGTCLYETWAGIKAPTLIRCPEGHLATPRPNDVQQGVGICKTCAGQDPAASEAKFLARLKELGATPMYDAWTDSQSPHLVKCSKGHLVTPRPSGVINGQGICRVCAGKEWNAFYVVTGGSIVKFGVTSGDPWPRLRTHAGAGLGEVVRIVTGLPGTVAPDTERAVKAVLALAGETPARGLEYFDISCLALILDVADSWLKLPASPPVVATAWAQETLFVA